MSNHRRAPALRTSIGVLLAFALVRGHDPRSQEPIEIARDSYGVPHVFATTDAGAFHGAGYAAAQDRLYQMLWNRVRVYGRSAEFFGRGAGDSHLKRDIRYRLFGWKHYAQEAVQRMDPEARGLLEAYAAGVNAFMSSGSTALGSLHSTHPLPMDPWTAADCVAVWNEMVANYSRGGFGEIEFEQRVIAARAASNTLAGQAEIIWPGVACDDEAAVVRSHHVDAATLNGMTAIARQYSVPNQSSCGESIDDVHFSDAWAVHGSKTVTGGSFLFGEPRITISSPSLLYEVHMVGSTFNARGACLPGSPNFLTGSNEFVGWSPTAVGLDQADLFRMQLTLAPNGTPNGYMLDGIPTRFAKVIRESIAVRGEAAQTFYYRQTEFGPLVTEWVTSNPGVGVGYAMKAIPFVMPERDPSNAHIRLLRSQSVAQFDNELQGWTFPPAHLVFAGVDGAIGYRLVGALPIRTAADPFAPFMVMPGTSRSFDWKAIAPHAVMPAVVNPVEDFVHANNHAVTGNWYPLRWLIQTGGHSARSYRNRTLLEQETQPASLPVTLGDAMRMRRDAEYQIASDVTQIGLVLLASGRITVGTTAHTALMHLDSWWRSSGRLDYSHYAAALAASLRSRLGSAAPLTATYGAGIGGMCSFLRTVTRGLAAVPPRAISDAEAAEIVALLTECLPELERRIRNAYPDPDEAASIFGSPSQWTTYFVDKVLSFDAERYTTPSNAFDPLADDAIFVGPCRSAGPVLYDGPNAVYSLFADFRPGGGAFATVLPLGESEIESSPHFLDQTALLEQGNMKVSPLLRSEIEQYLGPLVVTTIYR
ncbi:MAG: penicillin acylase family protein [Planctomycetota bacterium]